MKVTSMSECPSYFSKVKMVQRIKSNFCVNFKEHFCGEFNFCSAQTIWKTANTWNHRSIQSMSILFQLRLQLGGRHSCTEGWQVTI